VPRPQSGTQHCSCILNASNKLSTFCRFPWEIKLKKGQASNSPYSTYTESQLRTYCCSEDIVWKKRVTSNHQPSIQHAEFEHRRKMQKNTNFIILYMQWRKLTSVVHRDDSCDFVFSDEACVLLTFPELQQSCITKQQPDKWSLGDVVVTTLDLWSRGHRSQSGHYQVVSTWMGDGLHTGKPSRWRSITNTKVSSAFHPFEVDKSGWG